MRILYVADARSPIALGWIGSFLEGGHEVHLVSTFPASPMVGLASFEVLSLGFSGLARREAGGGQRAGVGRILARPAMPWLRGAGSMRLRASVRHWLGPVTIVPAARRLRMILADREPELVHALRLPMEGMLAAAANPACPLLISLWGNDLTLHAPAAPGMRRLTRSSLRRADGLHTDSRRDVRLARGWGYGQNKPSVVLPGNGGLHLDVFHPAGQGGTPAGAASELLGDSASEFAVNPRGFRGYVRSDTFFHAAALLHESRPGLRFLCPAMAGEPEAERWVARLRIGAAVRLLPRLAPAEMAEVFRRSAVSLSPSEHDGTPNTLLEAMACGALPICGDLESIREWIEDGVNGLLIDPSDPAALARAVTRALEDPAWRARAAALNLDRIQNAERGRVFAQADAFYRSLLENGTAKSRML